jgi:hypothetical protein
MLRGPTGVPTAVVEKCGSRLCGDCAADVARRQRRRIVERLEELAARDVLDGPVWRRTPRERVAEAAAAVEDRLREAQRAARIPAERRDAKTAALAELGERAADHEWRETAYLPGERIGFFPAELRAEVSATLARPRRPRDQKRPHQVIARSQQRRAKRLRKRGLSLEVVGGDGKRRTRHDFRVGLPVTSDAYGCRFVTLTQPARPGEPLRDAIERLEDALALLMKPGRTWHDFVDGSVVRIEFEWSTPERRKAAAANHEAEGNAEKARELRERAPFASWWHVHAHVLVWGRRWPQKPSGYCSARDDGAEARRACGCTKCGGGVDEDSLLYAWRRALVETKRYGEELSERCELDECEVRRAIRWHTHPSRRTWGKAVAGVRIGGAHIKIPRRSKRGARLSSWGALCEAVKYSTKPMRFASMPVERVAEVIEAVEGRRLVRCTGLLFGVHLYDEETDEKEHAAAEGMVIAASEVDDKPWRYAFDVNGDVVSEDDFAWRSDGGALEERRAVLEALADFHDERRATGPPNERASRDDAKRAKRAERHRFRRATAERRAGAERPRCADGGPDVR